MPPNVSKILVRWGLGEELAKRALKLETMHFNRCKFLPVTLNNILQLMHKRVLGETGEFLGVHVWSEEMLAAAGGDFMYIRVSMKARLLMITLILSCSVAFGSSRSLIQCCQEHGSASPHWYGSCLN